MLFLRNNSTYFLQTRMNYTRILLALAAGAAVVIVAKKLADRRHASAQGLENSLLPFISGLTLAELEDLHHLLPDNPVHLHGDADDHLFI